MFILSSISRGLELWPVNLFSIYENSESKVFEKYFLFFDEIFNNSPKDLLWTNVYNIFEFCW